MHKWEVPAVVDCEMIQGEGRFLSCLTLKSKLEKKIKNTALPHDTLIC